ncbi:PP2C family serine/threonine-protein phosphatase [Acinetobacter sp. YH12239]|uniref:PP2C family serine/threonine-protein phosphatase n=1 Tax=Acinetobacter sp. YH12239 TaxID=2601166 RepID=UPI0015D2CCEF|nr:hypothetical protein [Acinetobacter sp. YH12239]
MNIPIRLIDNLYSSYGADDANYIICPITNTALYCIADGHSQRAGSAEIVKNFSDFLKNQIKLHEINIENVSTVIIESLNSFRESIKRKFPIAAMCFVLVIKIANTLHIFYLGDCRLGRFIDDDTIHWITRPHSAILQENPDMTEEELRINEFNHIIYKQFITKKFARPEYVIIPSNDYEYILATDGFWKLLPEKQIKLLNGKEVLLEDDVAFLKF